MMKLTRGRAKEDEEITGKSEQRCNEEKVVIVAAVRGMQQRR